MALKTYRITAATPIDRIASRAATAEPLPAFFDQLERAEMTETNIREALRALVAHCWRLEMELETLRARTSHVVVPGGGL